jgi:hypothetical protein
MPELQSADPPHAAPIAPPAPRGKHSRLTGLQRSVEGQSESVRQPLLLAPLQSGDDPLTRMHWFAAPSIATQVSPPQSALVVQLRPQ